MSACYWINVSIGTMGTSGLPTQLDKMIDQIVGSQISKLYISSIKCRFQILNFIQSGDRDDN